uniref:Glutathione S-transferase n=1 Tax=Panagrolaimus superbus TaxID=310955 RepID=A0A914Y7P7_9BILA
MPHYKLIYFDVRGRAEAIRQLFKLAKVDFEDSRIDMDTWANVKESTPFGQVPVLEVNGKQIAQTNAILRYIGHEFGLAGSNKLENAQIDALADLLMDAQAADGLKQWPLVILGAIKEDKVAFFKEKVRPQLHHYAGLYEKYLVEHGRPSFILDNVTWVDVLAAEYFTRFAEFGESDALEAFPHIIALIERIHNLPEIKKHIQDRKPTAF